MTHCSLRHRLPLKAIKRCLKSLRNNESCPVASHLPLGSKCASEQQYVGRQWRVGMVTYPSCSSLHVGIKRKESLSRAEASSYFFSLFLTNTQPDDVTVTHRFWASSCAVSPHWAWPQVGCFLPLTPCRSTGHFLMSRHLMGWAWQQGVYSAVQVDSSFSLCLV